MTFGQRVKKLRLEKGVTQKEVADFIGVSDRVVGYYEADDRFPKEEGLLLRLANYFGVSTDYLLGNLDPLKVNENETDPDLRAIQRAREKMTPEQKDKMMKVLNAAFDDFFEDK